MYVHYKGQHAISFSVNPIERYTYRVAPVANVEGLRRAEKYKAQSIERGNEAFIELMNDSNGVPRYVVWESIQP
jgi:hypothetical protein